MLKLLKWNLAAAVVALGLSGPALAEKIVVQIDKSVMVTLASKPTTVVVGSPWVADATVSGNQVFINGFSAGVTNIIMLDNDGANIASLDVVVRQGNDYTVRVIKNGSQQTYNCVDDTCDPHAISGDHTAYFEGTTQQYMMRRQNARGEAAATQAERGGTPSSGSSQ